MNFQSVLIARLSTEDATGTIASIENAWKTVIPEEPFIYYFMDNQLASLYSSEQSSSKLLTTFSMIAIVIACVGLFGLAAFTASQRTKEIGVRKVLGATVMSIVKMISSDFTKLVLIAFLIGAPIAWIAMNQWLQSFAYRISLSIDTFMLAGGIVLLFTLTTISYQAIRAATANPVNSLKDE